MGFVKAYSPPEKGLFLTSPLTVLQLWESLDRLIKKYPDAASRNIEVNDEVNNHLLDHKKLKIIGVSRLVDGEEFMHPKGEEHDVQLTLERVVLVLECADKSASY